MKNLVLPKTEVNETAVLLWPAQILSVPGDGCNSLPCPVVPDVQVLEMSSARWVGLLEGGSVCRWEQRLFGLLGPDPLRKGLETLNTTGSVVEFKWEVLPGSWTSLPDKCYLRARITWDLPSTLGSPHPCESLGFNLLSADHVLSCLVLFCPVLFCFETDLTE